MKQTNIDSAQLRYFMIIYKQTYINANWEQTQT